MLLLPVPELTQVKEYKISLTIVIFLCLNFFLIEANKYHNEDYKLNEDKSVSYLKVQTKLYERHLKNLKGFKSKEQRQIASVVDFNSASDVQLGLLSRASILDSTFDPMSVSNYGIDPIEYKEWVDIHTEMKKSFVVAPAYFLGVNKDEYSYERWLTYLFAHIDFYHLISNCLFLLLFGALIETSLGGVFTLIIFLGTGFLAAPIFILLSDLSQISLVGASGGVCGLIGFYSILQYNQKIRYFYWVLPTQNYHGFMSLSAGLVILIWAAGDLAGYLSGVTYLDSVAYAAHLGGFITGSLCALGLLLARKLKFNIYFPFLK
jgi:membrane associated rhomboid family serine protease